MDQIEWDKPWREEGDDYAPRLSKPKAPQVKKKKKKKNRERKKKGRTLIEPGKEERGKQWNPEGIRSYRGTKKEEGKNSKNFS